MTSPALVILTEPAHCEQADANTLLQALLQVQQLSKAGVPVSQAFCDHPAEAMKFIDAYAKAYPELQLQSSDLPVPEHLYSMLADGRLNPLQAPDLRPDATKLEEAGRLQPLYVLSLGTPEILMQALKDNRLANNDIHVVEIAPVETLNSERLSVAEAVATRAVASPSWLAETTAESRAEEKALLPLEELGNAPLKLETVELDLDHIEIYEAKPAPPVVVDTARAIRATEDTRADRPVLGKAPTASDESSAKDTTVAPPAAAAAEPVSESRDTARTESSVTESNTGQIGTLTRDAAKPSEGLVDLGTEDPDLTAGNGSEHEDPSSAEETTPPDKLDPGAIEVSARPETGPEQSAAVDDEADDGIGRSDSSGETHSFSAPDEDVLYPPSSTFTSNEEDLAYSLPPDAAPEPGLLDQYFGLSTADDILDLEAIGRSLPPDTPIDHLDPVLMRPPPLGQPEPSGSGPEPDSSASDHFEGPESDRSDAPKPIVTTFHDLDI